MTRGFRNNNPGNIRLTFDKDGKKTYWKGEVDGDDPSFKKFRSIELGYRAMIRILRTYYNRYNLTTIEGIVSRWAPPNENDTKAYYEFVSERVGVPYCQSIAWRKDVVVKIVMAMVRMENGSEGEVEDCERGWEAV